MLILFGEGPDGPDLLLLQRADTLRKHAGQPAFPGGGIDPGDGGPVGAALREAAEETGPGPRPASRCWPTMPELYVSHSGYRVTPVVGWWRTPSAVAAGRPGRGRLGRARAARGADRPGQPPPGPRPRRATSGAAFRVRGMLVWGFTAGILNRVLQVGGWEVPWDEGRIEDLPPEVIDLATPRVVPVRT